MPRFYCPIPLKIQSDLFLPAENVRHIQVLRLQPNDEITLFNGLGGEFSALILQMGRNDVRVQIQTHFAIEREITRQVHLLVAMPANDRMDWLVEKATELGVASIQPLFSERTVLRLKDERAEKKRLHWQAISNAACEQSGRNRVPMIHSVLSLESYLLKHQQNQQNLKNQSLSNKEHHLLLSLRENAISLNHFLNQNSSSNSDSNSSSNSIWVMNGSEGGFSLNEEEQILASGFQALSLGSRVLRSETAPLAVLAALAMIECFD